MSKRCNSLNLVVRSRRITALLFAACLTPAAAQTPLDEGDIAWIDDPDRALEVSRQTGRSVIAYISSERCGFCRKMERETWTDPTIARMVHDSFVPLRLSASRHRAAVRSLRVRAYPTTVVLTPMGQGVSGAAGFLPPERLAKLLESHPAEAVAARDRAVGR